MNAFRNLAAMAGSAALVVQPQLAAAQEAACVTEAEVAAMVTYAMPSLVEGTLTRCASELSPGGFLARNGASLAGRYGALRASAWPQAKSGVLKLAGSDERPADDGLAMIVNLPDNALQPFVDALIVQELAQKITPGSCEKIERVMAALAPVEPAVAGNLVAVIFALADTKEPRVCPA